MKTSNTHPLMNYHKLNKLKEQYPNQLCTN
jgi:hypothetical protein